VNGRIHGIVKNYDKDNTNIGYVTLYKRNREVSILRC
jgi:hypothetical protein